MANSVRKSDVLRRVRTYPSPPKNFDPHKASQEELLRYGLPPRPDPDKQPEFARLWKRIFARPMKFEPAQVAVDPVMSARNPLRGAVDEFGANGWAGVVKLMSTIKGSDFTQPARMIFAHWQLPFVPPISPDETTAVAFWVGFDGHPSLGEPASKQVLQAGIAAQVNPPSWPLGSASTKWWAWGEWFTDSCKHDCAVEVPNFPVTAGDEISVVLFAPEPGFGIAFFANLTRGMGRSVGIPSPSPDIVAQGRSAEWIVEVPSQSPHMPIFGPVAFADCTSGSFQHGFFNLDNGITTDIGTPAGFGTPADLFTKSTITSATTFVVEELKLDWF